MRISAIRLAHELLASDEDTLESVRVYQFEDDVAAHDEKLQRRLTKQFEAAFEQSAAELVGTFGRPQREGADDDDIIPLNGVFRFAVWDVEGRALYLAASHEDRELPYLLMVGVESGTTA
jgi:hypothetical protein